MPPKISVPVPTSVKPAAPASGALTVAVLVTAMVGEPDETASVSALPPLAFKIQLCEPVPPLKRSVPALRAESSVTVRSAEMLMVLKSAVASVPLAMVPPSQLAGSLHTSLPSRFQAPLVAKTDGTVAKLPTASRARASGFG